jgi:hypothetical protein
MMSRAPFSASIGGAIGEDGIGQRLQPVLARDHRLGAALGLVGQIDVLKLRLGLGTCDGFRQNLGQLALILDRIQDRLAPRLHLAQIGQAIRQGAQLGVVEAAGHLLAVAGDEGDGGALIQQLDRGADLLGPGADLGCDGAGDAGGGLGRGVQGRLLSAWSGRLLSHGLAGVPRGRGDGRRKPDQPGRQAARRRWPHVCANGGEMQRLCRLITGAG